MKKLFVNKITMGVEMHVFLEYKPKTSERYLSFHHHEMPKDDRLYSFFNQSFFLDPIHKPLRERGIQNDSSVEFLQNTLLPITKKGNYKLFRGLHRNPVVKRPGDKFITMSGETYIIRSSDWGHSYGTPAEWRRITNLTKDLSKFIFSEMDMMSALLRYLGSHKIPCRVTYFFRN